MLNAEFRFDDIEDRFLSELEELYERTYLDESEVVYEERYENLSLKETVERFKRGRKARATRLSKYFVKPHQRISTEKAKELASIIRTARDERKIHSFLKDNPFILTRKIHPAHHAQICISKPKLGCQFEPDFLIAGLDSGGLWWYGVELENPNKAMFTKEGDLTSKLSHALRQIEDWRGWLRRNIRYAQDELGYTDIDADLPCYVIIGRRETEVLDKNTLHIRRREVQKRDKSGLFLHHYEWLLDDQLTLVKVK